MMIRLGRAIRSPSALKGGETDMMKDYIVGGRQYQYEEGKRAKDAKRKQEIFRFLAMSGDDSRLTTLSNLISNGSGYTGEGVEQ